MYHTNGTYRSYNQKSGEDEDKRTKRQFHLRLKRTETTDKWVFGAQRIEEINNNSKKEVSKRLLIQAKSGIRRRGGAGGFYSTPLALFFVGSTVL